MIPSSDELLPGLEFLARRFGSDPPSEQGLRAALGEAEALSREDERREPAALFHALARRPRALGGLWTRAPGVVANAHAVTLGLAPAPDDELRDLRMRVVTREATFDDVWSWFRAWYDR